MCNLSKTIRSLCYVLFLRSAGWPTSLISNVKIYKSRLKQWYRFTVKSTQFEQIIRGDFVRIKWWSELRMHFNTRSRWSVSRKIVQMRRTVRIISAWINRCLLCMTPCTSRCWHQSCFANYVFNPYKFSAFKFNLLDIFNSIFCIYIIYVNHKKYSQNRVCWRKQKMYYPFSIP